MNLRFMNWKVISLGLIAVVSFAPYLGAFSLKTLIYPEIKFSQPSKVMYLKECSSLLGVPCSKGLLFSPVELKATSIIIPGLTASVPRVSCVNEGKITPISSEVFLGSNVAVESLELDQCKGEIAVYFRADLDAAYGSWILPYMISGPKQQLTTLAKSVMFFRAELRTIFSGIVPFQVMLLLFLLSLLGSTTRYPYKYTFFTVSIMAIVNGAIVEKALFLPSNLFTPETKEFLGFLVLSIFFLESFKKASTIFNFLSCILVAAILEIACSYGELPKEIIWSCIIFGWGVITIATKFAFCSTAFFILNCFYLLSVLTPYNLIPPYAGTLFFMVYYLGVPIEQIRLKLLNSRINQMSRGVSSTKELEALVKLIAKVHHVERVSLSIVKNENFEHWGYTRLSHKPSKLSSPITSNVVSRVYASGKPLVHVDASKDGLGQKLSNKSGDYKSRFFSSFPVQINGQMWGVLSFTDYSKSILHRDAVSSLHGIFLECSEIVAKSLSQVTNRFATDFEKSFTELLEASETTSLESKITGLLKGLYNAYGVSGYFSEISEDNTIKLLYTSGTLTSLMDNINTKSFKVSTSNEFGPIALAFKEKTPVVLQNWKPISDKISAAAAEVYRQTNANSIVTVPISLSVGNNTFRYLFWMQTNDQRVFNSDFHRVGKIIQNKLSHVLESQLNRFVSDTVLSLADSEAIHNVVHGRDTSVKEIGELLMFDLCKSTQMGVSLSPEGFQHISQKYNEIVSAQMNPLGFKLQMVIGDALLLTRASNTEISRKDLLNAIYRCESELKAVVTEFASTLFGASEACLRVCSVHGDISRGVVKGTGGGWAITGSTISEVHKVEAVAKKFRSGIYFELDNRPPETFTWFIRTEHTAWTNGPSVLYVEFVSELRKAA